jgi:hypothetical protein
METHQINFHVDPYVDHEYSPLHTAIVRNEPPGKFRTHNVLDEYFLLNSTDTICRLPRKDACDRDSVLKTIQPAKESLQTT